MGAGAPPSSPSASCTTLASLCAREWRGRVQLADDPAAQALRLECPPALLRQVYERMTEELGYTFATLVVEDLQDEGRRLTYVLQSPTDPAWTFVELHVEDGPALAPSLSGNARGPAVDWHEREAEDLFGLKFEGHPRLGDFVLHEDWPDSVNPMRRSFDSSRRFTHRKDEPTWRPPTIVTAPGAFAMPVGPVFSDFAESAHFLLETVGEDVIRTIPRFFYKYRGVEKIAEGQAPDRVLLLAERFSGISAFAHGLAFCQALERICGVEPPPRAIALRTLFAELERLRHHAAVIAGICNSTALAIAASQATLIEEDLLRLSCEVGRHRYLFGLVVPGGVACDLGETQGRRVAAGAAEAVERLAELHQGLRYTSSFLDRLEEVGIISQDEARTYGLVGPIARASGVARDLRRAHPYASYAAAEFEIPVEQEGDGYARLRVLFQEAVQSAAIIRELACALPNGDIRRPPEALRAGVALGAVEAPAGAAFHWLRLGDDGLVTRYRITPPAFANWHGFHLAAENFAFQDFPIILATFGLSNAECDR